MCFSRPRRFKTSNSEDEDLLAPRPVSASKSQFKEYHNARIVESHLKQQLEISAVLDALDIQDKDYQTLPYAIDLGIDTVNGPSIVALLKPRTYRDEQQSRSDEAVLATPSIIQIGRAHV